MHIYAKTGASSWTSAGGRSLQAGDTFYDSTGSTKYVISSAGGGGSSTTATFLVKE